MREIVLASGTWKYKIGRGSTWFLSPQGKTTYTSNSKVCGVDPNTYERGQWKKTNDGMVTPAKVRAYIESTLL